MKVVDAGVIVELIANHLDPAILGDDELVVPHLIDSEVTNVIRRLVKAEALTEQQGVAAIDGFIQLTLTRYPANWLVPRIWQLRHNLSTYDAAYVALAEQIEATALLTTDVRLTTAPGITCPVELV